MLDYPKELLFLFGAGGLFTILLIYYVIRLERRIVKTLLSEDKRIKTEKKAREEAAKHWDKKQ